MALRVCYRSSVITGRRPTRDCLAHASRFDPHTRHRCRQRRLDHSRRHRVRGGDRRVRVLEQSARHGRRGRRRSRDQVRRLHAFAWDADLPRPRRRGRRDSAPPGLIARVGGGRAGLPGAAAGRGGAVTGDRATEGHDASSIAVHTRARRQRLPRPGQLASVKPRRLELGIRTRGAVSRWSGRRESARSKSRLACVAAVGARSPRRRR